MKDIKCPSCGKTFRIDPSSFEEILLQIKDEEFNKQIKERLILAEEDNKKALEILKRELKIQLIEQNRIKESEIQTLESKLKIAEEKKTNALNEAINDAKKEGWAKPSIVRFWRSSMKSIIKKSLEAVSIEPIVSRRTYNLLDRIEFLEKEIYPKEKGYVRGVLAPTFTSKMENSPIPLPEAVRGDALTISEISIGELKSAENWPMEFGDIFPIQQDLDDNYLVPGLRLFSKDRSLALSAWFSCLEPIKLVINKNQLILEASEDDKWLVTDLPEKDANILSTKF